MMMEEDDDVTMMESPPESPALSDSSRSNKKVSFHELEIIELPYTIGDGPASGVPLSVGWEPQDRSMFSVDFFEQYRPRRRSRNALRLPHCHREHLLLKNGHTPEEIEQACMDAAQTRKERTVTIQQLYTLRQLKVVQRSNQPAARDRMNAPLASQQALMLPSRS